MVNKTTLIFCSGIQFHTGFEIQQQAYRLILGCSLLVSLKEISIVILFILKEKTDYNTH